ncbi:alpha/beta fold hydrolase [Nocardia asteroides]|uniref:alpha/beta fold hydrolase n=1 Tax=Nocardia asteroides TaxID=1824 RepID=UPI0037CBA28F
MTATVGADPITIGTTNGLRLAATRTSGQAPLTILYQHGMLADSTFWESTMTAINQNHDITQIAIDARGHGRSQRPPHRDTTDITTLADDLATVIDHISGPILLVAHSLGSCVVMEHARRHPGQLTDRVQHILLFSCGERLELARSPLFDHTVAALRRMRGRPGADHVAAAGFAAMIRRTQKRITRSDGTGCTTPQPIDARVTADLWNASGHWQLSDIAAHTLAGIGVTMIACSRDRIIPPERTSQLAARIEGTPVHLVDGARHSLPADEPAIAAAFVSRAIRTTLHAKPLTTTIPAPAPPEVVRT